jgi:ERCC4-type nuclease
MESFAGIGPVYGRKLLEEFGTIQDIVNAPIGRLLDVKGFNMKKAYFMWNLVRYRYEAKKDGKPTTTG